MSWRLYHDKYDQKKITKGYDRRNIPWQIWPEEYTWKICPEEVTAKNTRYVLNMVRLWRTIFQVVEESRFVKENLLSGSVFGSLESGG